MKVLKIKNIVLLSTILICLISCSDGKDGSVGPSGLNSIIQTSNEPEGTNCEFGGLKVESGLDTNVNGALDSDEVLKIDFVCSIAGNNSLINIIDEPIGTTCVNGGVKIESGIDDNRNGILDTNEVGVARTICNGVDGGFDEQIRLSINYNANSTSTTPLIGGELINFNKNFFVNVDSIVLAANPYVGNVNNNALVELYNITDDATIPNSLISTNQLFDDREFIYSNNLFDDLPDKEITVGIKFSSETEGQFAASGSTYLFLYRKN